MRHMLVISNKVILSTAHGMTDIVIVNGDSMLTLAENVHTGVSATSEPVIRRYKDRNSEKLNIIYGDVTISALINSVGYSEFQAVNSTEVHEMTLLRDEITYENHELW